MSDPFIELFGARPNSTTQNPNTDIDYILTYGIQISGILTLGLICPAQSDHMGILLDIDLSSFFSSSFSDLSTHHPRSLALGNKQLVDYYLKYVSDKFNDHKILQRVELLYTIIRDNPSMISKEDIENLNSIDNQITEIMLAGEKKGARKKIQRFGLLSKNKLLEHMHITNKNLQCALRNLYISLTSIDYTYSHQLTKMIIKTWI